MNVSYGKLITLITNSKFFLWHDPGLSMTGVLVSI